MIKFRAHHFLCTLGFQGKGYSAPFIENYQKIVDKLRDNPRTPIKITKELDSICGVCLHQTKDKLCDRQLFIEKLDNAHQQILDLKENQIIEWASAKEAIKSRMTIENFHAACEGCEWKAYGICEAALRTLQDLPA